MSSWDTDSSSDSIPLIVYANNNRLPGSNDSVAESDSDDNESIQDNSDTSSGDSHNDAILINTDDSDIGPNSPTLSFAIDDPFLENLYQDNINVTTPKPNWCTPKELYNREIGKYRSPAIWCNKFYGSMTAVQKLKLVHQLKGHRGCVNTLDFNPRGDIIASGSDDQNICLWNWSLGKCLLKYDSGHHENVYQTRFLLSQGDIRIVSCGRDGLVRLSAVGKSHLYYNKLLASHYHSCNKLSVHKDLPYVVLSCGDDGVVKSIDIRESPIYENVNSTNIQKICNENGSVVRLFGIDTNPMNSLEFIVHGDDKFVRMYDKRKIKKEPVKIFCRKNFSMIEGVSHITSAVYNYCGTEILASYSEDDIYLFDVNSSPDTNLHQYGGHLNKITVKGVNFYGPKGEFVVSGSDCGHIFIWDKKTEAIVQKKHADANGIVNVLESHPHIPTLATSGLDKTIKIWQPLKGCIEPNILKLKKSIIQNRIERERGIRRD